MRKAALARSVVIILRAFGISTCKPSPKRIYLGGERFLGNGPEYLPSNMPRQNITPRIAIPTPMMRKTMQRGASQGITENTSPMPVLSAQSANVVQPIADEKMMKNTRRAINIVKTMTSQKTTLHSGSRLPGGLDVQGKHIFSDRIGRWRGI